MIQKLIDRWKAKTPPLFKALQRLCLGISASAAAVLALSWVPEQLKVIAGWALGVSTALATFLQFTQDKPKE
jgi:hypothetical protein